MILKNIIDNVDIDNKYENEIYNDLNLNTILIHGFAGCGKSYILKEIVKYLNINNIEFGYTATTGIAAINLNIPEDYIYGSTLHRWAGIKLGKGTPQELVMTMSYEAKNRWRNSELLIIDEVSMLGGELFDKLNIIGQLIRVSELPFGGLKLILCGDFLQLPPVKDEWIFKSEVWSELKLYKIVMDKSYRYLDEELHIMLNRIRIGEPTDEDIKILEDRNKAYFEYKKIKDKLDIQPTILLPKVIQVNVYNSEKLRRIKSDQITIKSIDNIRFLRNINKKYEETYIKSYKKLLDDCIPEKLIIKIGAQVMLRINVNIMSGLVNGSCGIVENIFYKLNENSQTKIPDKILVKFNINGNIIREIFSPHTWEYKDEKVHARRHQFPFILSWAITIHKAQGSTLESAICNIGSHIFESGQAYIAISRVRDINNLYLSSFNPDNIYANEESLDFVKKEQLL